MVQALNDVTLPDSLVVNGIPLTPEHESAVKQAKRMYENFLHNENTTGYAVTFISSEASFAEFTQWNDEEVSISERPVGVEALIGFFLYLVLKGDLQDGMKCMALDDNTFNRDLIGYALKALNMHYGLNITFIAFKSTNDLIEYGKRLTEDEKVAPLYIIDYRLSLIDPTPEKNGVTAFKRFTEAKAVEN